MWWLMVQHLVSFPHARISVFPVSLLASLMQNARGAGSVTNLDAESGLNYNSVTNHRIRGSQTARARLVLTGIAQSLAVCSRPNRVLLKYIEVGKAMQQVQITTR